MRARTHIIIFSLLVLLLFLLAACGKKAECETNTECTSSGSCFTAICSDGQCKSLPKTECCGNLQCEEDAGENICTCEKDCSFDATENGKCEGKVQLSVPNRPNSFYDATYARYYCGEQNCEVGIPPNQVQNIQLSSDHPGLVNFQMISTISKPFVLGKGTFHVKLTLQDISAGKAGQPIKLTGIQVLSGNELMGQKQLEETLGGVGASYDTEIPLTAAMNTIEENRMLTVKVNYEFQLIARDGTTTLTRTALETRYQQLPFIDPSKV